MPLQRLNWAPGVNTQQTQTANRSGWFASNLIRWRNGLLEKIGGWLRLFSTPCAGIPRTMHVYLDLANNKCLIIAGDGGLQAYVVMDGQPDDSGTLYNMIFLEAASGQVGLWTPTNTSTLVTVTDTSFNPRVGQTVEFPIPLSIGGRIIPAGYTTTVVGVPTATTWTFNMPQAALNSTATAAPAPMITFNSTSTASVLFTAHGLSTGNSFVFTAWTIVVGPFCDIQITPGATVTVTVTDANHFTFNAASFTTKNIIVTPITVQEGYISNTVPPIYSPLVVYAANPPVAGSVDWYLDNFGNFGIVSYTGSALYAFSTISIYNPFVTNLSQGATSTTSPQINTGFLTAMPQAQIIAFGSEVTLGGLVQDPLLLRWSDAGNFGDWTATVTNQAGSFRLGGSGSAIIGAIQFAQTTLIWTDVDLWSMTYVGPPFVYSFSIIGTGCGLISPYGRAILGRTCIWITQKGFFAFSDAGIVPLICPVWDVIFNDLDQDNLHKIFIGASASTHEFWVFYPSAEDGTGECTRYVKVNATENLWDYGSLTRSAWVQENLFGTPLGADENFRIQQHEIGYDADDIAMTGVFAETGYADIGDGDQIMYVNEFIQDMKWFGEAGAASLTLYGTNYPGQNPITKGPFGMDNTNRFIRPEMRARQIAMRIDWANRAGFSARLGTPRLRAAPAGRYP